MKIYGSIKVMAEEFNVSRPTIQQWIEIGKVVGVDIVSNKRKKRVTKIGYVHTFWAIYDIAQESLLLKEWGKKKKKENEEL